MDLTCYEEEIYIYILKKQMSAISAMNFFLKILNVKDAVLCAALPASIVFILLTTTTAPYVGINALVFWLVYLRVHQTDIFYHK